MFGKCYKVNRYGKAYLNCGKYESLTGERTEDENKSAKASYGNKSKRAYGQGSRAPRRNDSNKF